MFFSQEELSAPQLTSGFCTQLPPLNTPPLPQPHLTWHPAFSSDLRLRQLVGQLGVRR